MKANPVIEENGKYSLSQAAFVLGVNYSTIYRWIESGKLKCTTRKVNDKLIVRGSDLLKIINAQY